MFGLGFFEILVIFLVVIIFINPKDLPKVFRRLGRLVRQLRDIRDSSLRYMRRIEQEIEEEGRDPNPQKPDEDASDRRQSESEAGQP